MIKDQPEPTYAEPNIKEVEYSTSGLKVLHDELGVLDKELQQLYSEITIADNVTKKLRGKMHELEENQAELVQEIEQEQAFFNGTVDE